MDILLTEAPQSILFPGHWFHTQYCMAIDVRNGGLLPLLRLSRYAGQMIGARRVMGPDFPSRAVLDRT